MDFKNIFLIIKSGVLTSLIAGITLGCQSPPTPHTLIDEGATGKVYLLPLPDKSINASQPKTLSQESLATILAGVEIRPQRQLLQRFISGHAPSTPLFSEEDIQFLAPVLQQAFQQASSSEAIGFVLFHEDRSAQDTTEGILYTDHSSLHLTIAKVGRFPDMSRRDSKPQHRMKDRTGLQGQELLFYPDSALMASPSSFHSSEPYEGKTLLIDYTQFLPPSGGPSPLSRQQETIQDDPQALEALSEQKKMKIQKLQEELRNLRNELNNLEDHDMSSPGK